MLVLVRSAPTAPAITELTIRVLVAATSMVALLAPRVTPWFAASVASPVTVSVPPLIVIWSAVGAPGTAPRPVAAEIDNTPSVIEVLP